MSQMEVKMKNLNLVNNKLIVLHKINNKDMLLKINQINKQRKINKCRRKNLTKINKV
jgi:hypothetical protein